LILHFTIKINIYGAFAARLLKIPCVNSITGLGSFFTHKNIITLVILLLYRFTQRYPEKVFFLNKEDKDFFLKKKIIAGSQVEMIPGSGVDTEKYKPLNILKKSESAFTFLLFSRMIWDKGIKEYIEAARMMLQHNNTVKFQLLGFLNCDNPYAIKKKNIDKWVNEGIIEYLGETENVIPYIAGADCIVLPSYYGEGLPRVLLEAMSMGKPVIATNHVGCKDLVDDGVNGFLCEIKNARDLFDKMQKMINLTEKKRIEMGKKGRKKVMENYSDAIVTSEYLQIIDDIIKKSKF
jgi:glycosyltransferase involved in cell wall biosynthesis